MVARPDPRTIEKLTDGAVVRVGFVLLYCSIHNILDTLPSHVLLNFMDIIILDRLVETALVHVEVLATR